MSLTRNRSAPRGPKSFTTGSRRSYAHWYIVEGLSPSIAAASCTSSRRSTGVVSDRTRRAVTGCLAVSNRLPSHSAALSPTIGITHTPVVGRSEWFDRHASKPLDKWLRRGELIVCGSVLTDPLVTPTVDRQLMRTALIVLNINVKHIGTAVVQEP